MSEHSEYVEEGVEWLTVDDRKVRCRVVRPAPDSEASDDLPILLLHGLGGSSDLWGPVLSYLKEHPANRLVVAPDLPGYGRSERAESEESVAQTAAWVARLMDTLGMTRAHLGGGSVGGQIALALARRHPGRVGGLVLVGPTTGARSISLPQYMLGLHLNALYEPLMYNISMFGAMAKMGVGRYVGTVRQMLADDPLAGAETITAPCLIIRGEEDAIVPEAAARQIAEALPNGSFAVAEGVAHAVAYSAPELFVPTALAFWERAEAGMPAYEAANSVRSRSASTMTAVKATR